MVENSNLSKIGVVPTNAPAKKETGFLTNWFLEYYRFATLSACLILIAIGYFSFLGPKMARFKNLKNVVLIQEQKKQNDLESQLAYLKRADKKKAEAGEEVLARMDAILPKDSAIPALLTVVDGLARDSGVSIENININITSANQKSARPAVAAAAAPDTKKLPEGVKTVDLILSVTAKNYRELKIFLDNVERSSRLMDALSLNYNPGGSTYTLIVRTYFQPIKTVDDSSDATADGS